MEINQPLFAGLGLLAAVVVTLADRRNAVSFAALAAGLGLAPSVAVLAGADGALVLIGAGVLAAAVGPLSRAVAHRVSWMAGLDPVVPVVARADALFGPRSVRVAAAVLALPAASWVSFNVPVGAATTISGVLFPAALVWGCSAMRLLTARTLVDLAVGVAGVGVSGAAASLVAGGVGTLAVAAAAASLAPAAALTAGWLSGRHAAAAAGSPP
jgi:hypothetical protein